ncbi:energy-coupling factor ABC transporter permease [Halothiobacillus sp. DCM-1]|uniref:energy-coupling factor ABC transporter permease n=1 Tax=Halothiobacillus sp. DCM-1 TaxID=3112558 RepID=UPI00324F51EA
MWISGDWLSPEWLLSGWVLAILLLGWSLFRAPWRALQAAPWRWNLVLAAVVWLFVLWQLRAPVLPGISLHLWGLTLVTLLLGWPLALLTGLLVAAVDAVLHAGLPGLPWVWLATVLPAVALTEGVHRLAVRWLPPNIFIFVFVEAFLAAMLALAATALGVLALFSWAGIYPSSVLMASYWPFLPLQAVPEGMVNGIALLGLALLHPEWVYGFDETRFSSHWPDRDKFD